MSAATISREVWNMGRLTESSSSDSPRQISDQDWPALEETVEKVTKLSLLDVNIGSTAESEDLCPTPPKASLSPTSTDSGNEDLELWNEAKLSRNWADSIATEDGNDLLSSSASSNNGFEDKLDGNLESTTLTRSMTTISADSRDSALSMTPIPPKQKSSKGSKKKWIPLTLPDLPPLKPNTAKRQPSKPQMKQGNKEIPHNSPVAENLVDENVTTTPARRRPSLQAVERARAGRTRGKPKKYRSSYGNLSFMSSDATSNSAEFLDFNMSRSRFSSSEFIMPYFGSNSEFYHPSLMDEKVIAGMLKSQLEYYFSEENLSRDFYLRRKMDSEGYLPIHLIASFQRVQFLTQDFQLVLQAVESSSKLELKDGCVRTILDPFRWPIIDSVPLSPVALMPPSSRSFSLSDPIAL